MDLEELKQTAQKNAEFLRSSTMKALNSLTNNEQEPSDDQENPQAPLLKRSPTSKEELQAKKIEERRKQKRWVLIVLSGQLFNVLVYFAVGVCYYGIVCDWSVVDCIYFSVAVVTSVGYGDISPPKENGPLLFSCFYMLAACFLLAACFSKVMDALLSGKVADAMMALEDAQNEQLRKMLDLDGEDSKDLFGDGMKHAQQERNRRWRTWFKASGMMAAMLIFGTVAFMTSEPHGLDADEDLSPFVRALYFCVTTVTTVGFGDVTPKNDSAKIVDIIFMLVGIPVFGNFLASSLEIISPTEDTETEVAELVQVDNLDDDTMKDLLQFRKELKEMSKGKLSSGKGKAGEIDCTEYMAFILVRNNIVRMNMLEEIVRSFNRLDADQSGFISIEDIVDSQRRSVARQSASSSQPLENGKITGEKSTPRK